MACEAGEGRGPGRSAAVGATAEVHRCKGTLRSETFGSGCPPVDILLLLFSLSLHFCWVFISWCLFYHLGLLSLLFLFRSTCLAHLIVDISSYLLKFCLL